ncbi:MAG TPA: cytochrome c oxidase subunit II [Azospirillum sp.]|nr:cytochrome c oxidase subunit II [Azospirillum sp.]
MKGRVWPMLAAAAFAVPVWPAFAQETRPAPGGVPHPWQVWHPEPATPVMEIMYDFHHLLLWIMVAVCILVMALLGIVIVRFNAKRNPVPSRTSHNTLIEVIWTVVPVIILVVIAVPSFRLLYYADRAVDAEMTVKVTGRQWYWDYEYPDHGGFTFSSIMIPEDALKPGQPRLLEVDNRVVLPVGTTIRLLVTGGDVIHSWAVPAFGSKDDAVPGRINETWIRIDAEGVYYGQCSEICGTSHAYMPIAVEAVSKERFAQWVEEAKTRFAARDAEPTQLAER